MHTCPDFSYTEAYQQYIAMAFSYYITNTEGIYKCPVIYRGPNAAKVFMESIKKEAEEIEKIYTTPKPMIKLTEQEQESHTNANVCYLCEKKFSPKNLKVMDHCHLTRSYRGAACNDCNLKFKTPRFLPIFFHNLSNYDLHMFV